MSLRHILTLIAANGGLDLTNQAQVLYTTALVNMAAKELYEQNDMVGCLREQVYHVNPPQGNLVSLEPYVGQVRAVRYFYPGLNLKVRSSAPRYVARFYQTKDFTSWELKGDRPLLRDIQNASILNFQFLAPTNCELKISIIGTSPLASQVIETLCVPKGTTVISSVNQYTEISALTKNIPINANCIVSDIDGNNIATLANHQLKSLYQIIQVINLPNNQYGTSNRFVPASNFVETYWKLRLKPMIEPDDEFICPGYDDAIFWKYAENKALMDATQSVFQANQAQKYADKANKILKDISQDASQTEDKSMNFGENPTLEAYSYITQNQSGYGLPGAFPQSPYPLVWP